MNPPVETPFLEDDDLRECFLPLARALTFSPRENRLLELLLRFLVFMALPPASPDAESTCGDR